MGWILLRVNIKMNFYREPFFEKNETLKLVGSQINLTPRSDYCMYGSSCTKSCKISSLDPSSSIQSENRPKNTRPKSADYRSPHHTRCNSTLQWPLNLNEKVKSGMKPKKFKQRSHNKFLVPKDDSSLRVSHFTDSSSKLLQNLIETPNSKTAQTEDSSSSDSYFGAINTAALKNPVPEKYVESDNYHEFSKRDSPRIFSGLQVSFMKDNVIEGQLNTNLNVAKVRQSFPEITEEKTVRFLDSQHLELPGKKFSFDIKCTHFSREIPQQCSKSEFLLPHERTHTCRRKRKTSNQEHEPQLEAPETIKYDSNIFKILLSDNEHDEEVFKKNEKKEEEIYCQKMKNLPRENDNGKHQVAIENANDTFKNELPDVENVSRLNSKLKELSEEKTALEDIKELKQNTSITEIREQPRKLDDIVEGTNYSQKINLSDSTYEEIVQLLQTLEDEDSENINMKNREESIVESPVVEVSPDKIDYLDVVSSYLEEVELKDITSQQSNMNAEKWNFEGFSSPRLEELLNKNPVELAHEVFSLKIQVEDQKKGLKLLKEAVAEMKEAKKTMELEHQEALQKTNSEAEVLVQRHQKFIKQLLNEKNNLNETVSKLVQDLKSGEEKHKKNLKAIEEKHVIEIKRAKEAQAVADKIKREKWMEIKTQKIKEMTIKGLEPELSRMAVHHQEEMTELRNLHKAEIEAIELRAARRTSDLMDELRMELTKEKERVVAKETASIRAVMEKEFEEERNRFQQHCQTLKDSIRKLEEKFSQQELEFKQKLMDIKQEEEKKKQKIIRDHEENLEGIRRQHLIDLRNLRESLEAEREVLINNYKKQQVSKFFEREAELHKQYKRERDREIEMIIETLENEAAQIQSELTAAGETKLKRLREKMEAELKEIEGSEATLKVKLSETKSKLSEKEDFISELNSQIRQLQTELVVFKKSCEEMSSEKARMKEIIRGEFENGIAGLIKEKDNLEKEMSVCKELHARELAKKDQLNIQVKHEMQKELTRVYSRIKTAVGKKEKIIESLRQENGVINQRCRQLELMLDHQRRNLLLQ